MNLLAVFFWTLWLSAVCATVIAFGHAFFQRHNDHNDP